MVCLLGMSGDCLADRDTIMNSLPIRQHNLNQSSDENYMYYARNYVDFT